MFLLKHEFLWQFMLNINRGKILLRRVINASRGHNFYCNRQEVTIVKWLSLILKFMRWECDDIDKISLDSFTKKKE